MNNLFKDIIQYSSIAEVELGERFKLSPHEIKSIIQKTLGTLWGSNPAIYQLLKNSSDLEDARASLLNYLNTEEELLVLENSDLHPLERAVVRDSITTMKSIISKANEELVGQSALEILFRLARGQMGREDVSEGFLLEFIHLFRGICGLSGIYSKSLSPMGEDDFSRLSGRDAARARSRLLDAEERDIEKYVRRYATGIDPDVVRTRQANKKRILKFFKARDEDWDDYRWQLRHDIRDAATLRQLIDLSEEEEQAIDIALANRIPFGITPYYVALMDKDHTRGRDHSVRAQVIPPLYYATQMAAHRDDRSAAFDFMGEHDTSPIELVTRRYPQIAIFKPYNSCAQICVYCQRNWEIDQVLGPHAMAAKDEMETALDWFTAHPAIQDVLVTGGDPLIMSDDKLRYILDRLAALEHVQRIRIGTRTPVVLPQRFTDAFVDMLASYREFGRREIAVVTHFEHVWEITPEAIAAIKKVRESGIGVYNQTVYTFENSRKFELVALRRMLRLAGIDPYYTFNTKGKGETRHYRVPIARILQERKEEARLMPGLDRTDEPVFNVPRLGKNHLRSSQDHRILMILPDGRRVYEFLPWEKNLLLVPTYNYTDVSIFEYLQRLQERGEDIAQYRTIWYYY